MIYYIKEAMRVSLTPEGFEQLSNHFNPDRDGMEYVLLDLDEKDTLKNFSGTLISLKSGNKVVGSMVRSWLNHYGSNINSEVFALLKDYEIKSFQAELSDGRTINLSYIN